MSTYVNRKYRVSKDRYNGGARNKHSPYGREKRYHNASQRSGYTDAARQNTYKDSLDPHKDRIYGGRSFQPLPDITASDNKNGRNARATQEPHWEDDASELMRLIDEDRGGKYYHPEDEDAQVRRDHRIKGYGYFGTKVARQFDLSLKYVRDMMYRMYHCHETVSCFSLSLLKEGQIVYYLSPFVLGCERNAHAPIGTPVGGSRFAAEVYMKGRFGVITRKYAQHCQVAEMYTFNGLGLRSKPAAVRREYVGLREREGSYAGGSEHEPLVIQESCCDLDPKSSIHLVPTKVSLGSQIMIAGSITPESLLHLRGLIKVLEEGG